MTPEQKAAVEALWPAHSLTEIARKMGGVTRAQVGGHLYRQHLLGNRVAPAPRRYPTRREQARQGRPSLQPIPEEQVEADLATALARFPTPRHALRSSQRGEDIRTRWEWWRLLAERGYRDAQIAAATEFNPGTINHARRCAWTPVLRAEREAPEPPSSPHDAENVLGVMVQGREYTASELAVRVSMTSRQVGYRLSLLRRERRVSKAWADRVALWSLTPPVS